MPEPRPFPLVPPPGVVKNESILVSEGRWIDSQWVRFVDGKAEKMGGWTVQDADATDGIPRTMHAWRDLSAQRYMAASTYKKLYAIEISNWGLNDITPLAASGTLGNNPFTTTAGSPIVSVASALHGRASGDTVIFSGASAVGGITISGSYTVLTVTNANAYTIQHTSNASSSATGGGASVAYEYEVSIGTETGTVGLGYGVGRYGIGTYGTARLTSTLFIEPRVWSLDHFGENLLGAFQGGTIYAWDPDTLGAGGRAEAVSGAPTDVRAMFVTEERFVFALCEDMRVDWCSQNDYGVWTPLDTNTANTRRLQIGTKLIGGKALGNRLSLVWSDAALYVFQYTGSSSVFSSRMVSANCGLISPNAAVVDQRGHAYWMGNNSFYVYAASVAEVPNVDDIKQFVFDNLRTEYGYLCWGHYNAKHDEIRWEYVSLTADNPDRYVVYSIKDQAWAVGTLARTGGTSFDHGETRPYFAAENGLVYLHEDGANADGAAIEAYIELAPYALDNGSQLMDVNGIIADFPDQVGDLTMVFEGYDRLRHAATDSQTKVIAEDDDLIDLRISGRHIGFSITSNEVDGHFRYGKPTALVTVNGARR
jgi:hypothetical protein